MEWGTSVMIIRKAYIVQLIAEHVNPLAMVIENMKAVFVRNAAIEREDFKLT